MASTGDIIQLTMHAAYLGQAVANVFHWRLGSVGTGIQAAKNCEEGFRDDVEPKIQAVTNAGFVINRYYVVNLADPSDFYDSSVTAAGSFTGTATEYLPSEYAASMRYTRRNPTQRNGGKRFAGLSEAQVEGNTMPDGGGLWENLKDALWGFAGVTDSGMWFDPFVASRPISYGTNPSGYVPLEISFAGLSRQKSRRP